MLRPAILWNDQRTAAECAEIEERVGLERLIELTGNRALTGFTAPKLLWLRTHEPEVYAQIRHILLPKDYVRLRLCGERAIDVADASGTLLFDVAERRFSTAVLDALEVPESWMPRSLESPEVSGRTAAGVPVAAGAGDCAAAALGVGVERPGPVSLVLGTSGVVFAALPAYQPDAQARVHVFCHAVPGAWHAMGVMLSAAGSLQWARDTFAPGRAVRRADGRGGGRPGRRRRHRLPALPVGRAHAARRPGRARRVRRPERAPHRGHVMRAVLEGVAFGLADSFDLLRDLGVEATVARASGGGARSDFWLRICASVLGVPVCRMAVDEGSAFGAAMLGGIAGGMFAGVGRGRRGVRARARPDRPRPRLGRRLRRGGGSASSRSTPRSRACSADAQPGLRRNHRRFTADSQARRRGCRYGDRPPTWHARVMAAERTADMRRVLIVDDEASITDAVATALRYEGFDTCEIASGRAAVTAIDEFRPDLIILDVMLPDLDGLAVARRLRDRRVPVPVIFLSAKDATEDKIAGLALGDDYVTKPFSLAELVARVQTVLRRTQGDDGHVLRFADVRARRRHAPGAPR